jgi:NAD(P)-dependent dehydrogenase (short-subunit alcohol dehydrogenase family)
MLTTVPIVVVISGPIDTPIFRDGEEKGLFNAELISGATLLGRMGKAHEVAKVLCFLLSDGVISAVSYFLYSANQKQNSED